MPDAITRRHFLKLVSTAATVSLLSACAPSAQPAPTATPKPAETTKPAAPAATQAPKPAATAGPAATQAPAATVKPAAGPKKGGTFTLARVSALQHFSPYSLNPGTYPLLHSLWDTLVYYDQTLTPKPQLAESWQVAPDSKSITLKLRQGVRFHSGREFTSADVQPSLYFGQTDERSIMAALLKQVTKVDTPDKYTVVLNFANPTPLAFDVLDVLYIIDKETIEQRATTAIGTGPFKIARYVPNDVIEMVAFQDYWDKGKPYLDKYIVRQVPDVSALALNLEAGAIDCAYQISISDTVRLKAGGKYLVNSGTPGTGQFDVGINVSMEPLTNKKLRQAISHSIDRDRFAKTILGGLVEPTTLLWPKNSWAYFADLQGKMGYDLDKARSLLKEAGYEKGFPLEILATTDLIPYTAELAQIMQADLKKIGIDAKVLDLEGAQYQARTQTKRDMQVISHSYGRASRDPGSLLTGAKSWYTGKEGSWTHFDSPEYERLRSELQTTLDREKRKVIARAIQELVLDECFSIPVAPVPIAFVYGSYVKGFDISIENSPLTSSIWLDK